mmetsp:Transcript_153005/g.490858  ORF Transcript_153005/g.490858 Transcript_153005/m.490858 type:complete len:243 (+) Transcript_153005:154-882(+)
MVPSTSKQKASVNASFRLSKVPSKRFWKSLRMTNFRSSVHPPRPLCRTTSGQTSYITPVKLIRSCPQVPSSQRAFPPTPSLPPGSKVTRWKLPERSPATTKGVRRAGRQLSGTMVSTRLHSSGSKKRSSSMPCNTTHRFSSTWQVMSRTPSRIGMPPATLKRIVLRSTAPSTSWAPKAWIQPSGLTTSVTSCALEAPRFPTKLSDRAANCRGVLGRRPSGSRATKTSRPICKSCSCGHVPNA